jgi:hypothetical protein
MDYAAKAGAAATGGAAPPSQQPGGRTCMACMASKIKCDRKVPVRDHTSDGFEGVS